MYTVADSDLQMRGGTVSKNKFFFRPFGGQFGRKIGGGSLGSSPGSATAYIGRSVFLTYLGRSKGVLLNRGVRMTS